MSFNYIMASGQITLESDFGKALKQLAELPSNKVFLDIGTWNGQGTTLCLVAGLHKRSDLDKVRLVSVEANDKFYKIAKEFYKNAPPWITLIKGRIAETMMTASEIESHPNFKDVKTHYDLWYKQDKEDFSKAPLCKMTGKIDVVVLDGGEFCGEYDLKAVLPLVPTFICLDDINFMKNNTNFRLLITNPQYKIIGKSTAKNGWAIFQRVF